MKLYGVPLSPYVRKVQMVLAAKGVEYDLDPLLPINLPDSFAAVSPLKKIPALVDGELSLGDSAVICQYLDEKYADGDLYGTNAEDRARVRWLETYAGEMLAQTCLAVFSQRIVRPKFMNETSDEALVKKIIDEELPVALSYLESQLNGAYFVGDDVTVADFAVVSFFITAQYAGVTVDATEFPKLSEYLNKMMAHEIVAPLMAVEADMLRDEAAE